MILFYSHFSSFERITRLMRQHGHRLTGGSTRPEAGVHPIYRLLRVAAVRFGRVPKKEKAKIMEQMQKVNLNSQCNYLAAILQNDNHVIQQTVKAHLQTSEFTKEKFERFQKKSWQKPEFVACPATRVSTFALA